MEAKIEQILEEADWESLYPEIIGFAEMKLRNALGLVVSKKKGHPIIDGMDANKFLDHAIDKTLSGVRRWDPEETDLKTHLNGVIRSDISNLFKKGIAILDSVTVAGEPHRPIDIYPDHSRRPDGKFSEEEFRSLQNAHFRAFHETIQDDPDLKLIFEAYYAGFVKPRDIADVTGLDARKVDELKRKFLRRYLKFTDGYAGPLSKTDLVKEKL